MSDNVSFRPRELLTAAIPGYLAGTWKADPASSEIAFAVRQLMVSTARGGGLRPGRADRHAAAGRRGGARALTQVWAILLRAYPDLHVTVEDLIAEGDKLVARNSVTGTHLGDYLGRPPTGRSVRYDEIFILRFANGRIIEMWGVVDVLAQMRQLGAIQQAEYAIQQAE